MYYFFFFREIFLGLNYNFFNCFYTENKQTILYYACEEQHRCQRLQLEVERQQIISGQMNLLETETVQISLKFTKQCPM